VDGAETINLAAQKMLREHVHHLVVMQGEFIVGVLSAFDFVRLAAEYVISDDDDDISENMFMQVNRI